jgi:hypothetical protein
LICCPDNAQEGTEVAPPFDIKVSTAQTPTEFELVDYNAIRNHPNIKLINERQCGQSTSDRIVGGEEGKKINFII